MSTARTAWGTAWASASNSSRVNVVLVRPSSVSLPRKQNRAVGQRSAKALRMRRQEVSDG